MQVLQLIKIEDFELFENIFGDLDYELEEQGWKDHPEELMNTMLENHFGLALTDERQLKEFTRCVLDKKLFKSAFNTMKLKRGVGEQV